MSILELKLLLGEIFPNLSGGLSAAPAVLDRAGFVRVSYNLTDDWSVMWAHDYPFTKIKPVLLKMKKHQKVGNLH